MTNLFVVFVAAFLVPLMFHSWRVAVLGLGAQGLLLGMILLATHELSVTTALEAINLFIVRALLVPWLLLRSMGTFEMSPPFSLIRKSISQWLLAFTIVVIGSLFGRWMAPEDSLEAFQVGSAAIAILISMLVLANQHHAIGQIIGVITFESGLTLVELLSPHAMPFFVRIGLSILFVCLLFTLIEYIKKLKLTQNDDERLEDGIVL